LHPDERELDRHAAGRLRTEIARRLDEHLRRCPFCRARLAEITVLRGAPARFVHGGPGCPVILEIRVCEGGFAARVDGGGIELERGFRSAARARSYLLRSFRELFPEHRCGDGCG